MRTALVLGGGRCIWEDVEAALNLGEFAGVVACNDIAADWPGPLSGAASLHPDHWVRWTARRAAKGFAPIPVTFGQEAFTGRRALPASVMLTDHRFPGQIRSGSSGLFALKVALTDLGFDRAVLCGVPMSEAEGHIVSPSWRGAETMQTGWTEALPAIRDRARSMSGFTAALLGKPDPDWLQTGART